MSYDIWLQTPLGHDGEMVDVGSDSWNYTSNCAPMWRDAGADLAEFDGKLASECITPLEHAIATMEAQPEKYAAMNPSNGWGSYRTLLPALRRLLDLFHTAPGAHVRVWR